MTYEYKETWIWEEVERLAKMGWRIVAVTEVNGTKWYTLEWVNKPHFI
jgi:hypothetical protein